jgi:hypothetical protein
LRFVRVSGGYEPRFDILVERVPWWALMSFEDDLELGWHAEFRVADMLQLAPYMLEVKRDSRALETGNVFVEMEQAPGGVWKPSGVNVSWAQWFAFVLANGVVVFVEKVRLLELVRGLPLVEQRRDESNPARGCLVRLVDLLGVSGE